MNNLQLLKNRLIYVHKIIITSVLVSFLLFFNACQKSNSQMAADMIVGTFKGSMWTSAEGETHKYEDFLVKVEKNGAGEIKVSCLSTPKTFEPFSCKVMKTDGSISSYTEQNIILNYYTTGGLLSLNLPNSANNVFYNGYK